MKREFGSVKIKSNWFDWKDEKRKILKIGYKGLFVYLTLSKFRIVRLDNTEFIIHVSIDLLRKETGYPTNEVIEVLKLLINKKIIKLKRPSRWDRLFDKTGTLQDKEMLTFLAIDVPKTDLVTEHDKVSNKPRVIDKPRSEEDFYISVDMDMLEHYRSVGLNEKYFPLYCLVRKLSNGSERKAYMTIQKMAETLGVHHDTIHKYIKELNKNYLLYSRLKMGKKNSYQYEHFLARSVLGYKDFLYAYENDLIKNIKRWEKETSIGDQNELFEEIVSEGVEEYLDEIDDNGIPGDVSYQFDISESEWQQVFH